MVAAAHPLATQAGLQMLQAGGSALDAAVAVQMVLALVEPQSSGIGGGAFMLHWNGRQVQAYDGRETAPAAATERLFMQADGQAMPFAAVVGSGRAVGVPGAVRMLETAHRAHGRLPWARLFEPALALAREGFALSPRLHAMLRAEPGLKQDARAAALYFDASGQPWPVGHRLRNPALAQVLSAVASQGSAALHAGPVAADIVARVNAQASASGPMSLADLMGYRSIERAALCTDWLAVYRVCGMPPPASGHLAIMQILGVLQQAQVEPGLTAGIPGEAWLHHYAEAARLAFADRAQHVADPAFVQPPGDDWNTLLGSAYLRQRAALIGPQRMRLAPAGAPGVSPQAQGRQIEQPEAGTSHISIVDGDGRAVALTTSIEAAFGARIMSDGGSGLPGGFLLNNQLTDFSFAPTDAQGRPVANRVQPGKRPRSSMSPTLVFDRRSGRLLMSLGSPGGALIIHFTAKTLLGTLAWGLSPQQAIALPNFASLGGSVLLEARRFPADSVAALNARGHAVIELELPSGLQAIQRQGDGWRGGADPRREGLVLGQ